MNKTYRQLFTPSPWVRKHYSPPPFWLGMHAAGFPVSERIDNQIVCGDKLLNLKNWHG
jgi:hypothetical protein